MRSSGPRPRPGRLDEAEVGVLAGASGCADGFNEAIAKIPEQASTGN
jgi:hypothetical protein